MAYIKRSMNIMIFVILLSLLVLINCPGHFDLIQAFQNPKL